MNQEQGRQPRHDWLVGGLLAVVLVLVFLASRGLGLGGEGRPPDWPSPEVAGDDGGAAAGAQEFLRLVADSRRSEDTAPLPCTLVTDTGGLLNPCVDALTKRWPELEPVERAGPRLTVRSVTSSTATTVLVTDADISPRLDAPISITLERVAPGAHGWKVRQLNQSDLPR